MKCERVLAHSNSAQSGLLRIPIFTWSLCSSDIQLLRGYIFSKVRYNLVQIEFKTDMICDETPKHNLITTLNIVRKRQNVCKTIIARVWWHFPDRFFIFLVFQIIIWLKYLKKIPIIKPKTFLKIDLRIEEIIVSITYCQDV